MKRCTKCGDEKPTGEFSKDALRKDGLNYWCKQCSRAAAVAWSKNNREKHRARSSNWAANNPEKCKEYAVKSRAKNRDARKAYNAKWRAENPDKVRAMEARCRAKNPEAFRIKVQNRRVRELANAGELSKDIAERLFKLQRGKCACCKEPLGNDFHRDHIMPLALGGANTDDNIQLLRAKCNLRKSAKHPIDFMQQRGFLL